MPVLILLLFVLSPCTLSAKAFGYGAAAKGGAGGETQLARSAEELRALAGEPDRPLIIQVAGELNIGTVIVRSNKTIEGVGGDARLVGTLHVPSGATSVIIRNLTITNPSKRKNSEGFDGITIRGGRDVWIDSCTLRDCADGAVDVTQGADRVTISRCKFEYSSHEMAHRFPILALGPPKKKAKGRLHLTLAENWFGRNCGSRMPAARKARVHQFNNFFDCPGNDYCSNAREDAEILSEGNFYNRVKNPLYAEDNGRVRSKGDIFKGTSGRRDDGDDKVFQPDYSYSVGKASRVPELVPARAGAR
jgi:pectate lyase